ncbi:MAG: glycoside hydrolase family 13 protein [Candidatus Neomarinimicrobiota bacterium]
MRKYPSFRKSGFVGFLLVVCICVSCQTIRRHPTAAPEWAADAVWYQIFPERFRNGDPGNDPTRPLDSPEAIPGWRVHPWGSDFYHRQPWEQNLRPDDFYWMHLNRRYGGDLQGIIDKLDYLAGLGVNALYLNPIFDADSHHKYDGNTYHHIDYQFGPDPGGDKALVEQAQETEHPSSWVWTKADRLFLKLLAEAHARNMHVIIDGVFNHVGRSHFAFKDVMENQQRSPYADWFEITAWDDPNTPENEFDYHGWWGIKTLPEIREEHGTMVDGPKQYIFDSVARWMDPNGDGDPSDGVDGWRLDVVEDMGTRWWKEWHVHVRRINPNVFTTAEIWGIKPRLLRENLFTSSMNYPFAMAVVPFVGGQERKLLPSAFDEQLAEARKAYGFDTSLRLQNLIDSHDTDRMVSMLNNPDRNYDRHARPDQHPGRYDIRKPTEKERHLQKLMVALQVTCVGAPMIYYGDEVGMWGEDDPGCRKPMLWDDIIYEDETEHPLGWERSRDTVAPDHDLLAFYRSAIALRRKHSALRRGSYQTILVDDERELFGFTRWNDEEALVAVVNNSDEPQDLELADASQWEVLFTVGELSHANDGGQVMGPRSFVLFRK